MLYISSFDSNYWATYDLSYLTWMWGQNINPEKVLRMDKTSCFYGHAYFLVLCYQTCWRSNFSFLVDNYLFSFRIELNSFLIIESYTECMSFWMILTYSLSLLWQPMFYKNYQYTECQFCSISIHRNSSHILFDFIQDDM